MLFENLGSILYSDTLVPDVFISEYLPTMDGDQVKVYLHCLFLCKYNKNVSTDEISSKLCLSEKKTEEILKFLEVLGVIGITRGKIVIIDLKNKEINRLYKPKITSNPDDASSNYEKNSSRIKMLKTINQQFFQGIMSPSWYMEIDSYFERYGFSEEVIYALFSHCNNKKILNKPYVSKVAESWYSKDIKTFMQLENHFARYHKNMSMSRKIAKKLNLSRELTVYEQDFIDKWINDYGYDFDVIELALIKTTGKAYPSIKYIDGILKSWHSLGYKNVEDINSHETKKSYPKIADKPGVKGNFKQHEYTDEEFKSFITKVE
jgi:DnaD/phage-associated family protein